MEKNTSKILQIWYEARARFAFVCLSVVFLSNNKEPCCTQKYATKKDEGTQAIICILSRNFEAHGLTAWKNTSMLLKPKIGWGAPCACTGFMKRALNSDFLTN